MLKFELKVEERKTLAKRMEELTGIHPYYTKAPRYAYDIGNYTIDRDGNLLVEAENADLELSLIHILRCVSNTSVQNASSSSVGFSVPRSLHHQSGKPCSLAHSVGVRRRTV